MPLHTTSRLVAAGLALALTGAPHVAVAQTRAATASQAMDDETWPVTVRRGDTLKVIARRYLADPDDTAGLARANRLSPTAALRPGSTVRIPLRMLRTYAGGAEVLWTRGQVAVVDPAGTTRPLTTGARVEARHRVETANESAVRLRLVGGSLLLLGENTRVTVEDLTVYVLSGLTNSRITVERGRVETDVRPLEPRSRYEIRTPVLTTAVRGTEFRVAALDATRAQTEVVTGLVDASAGANTVGVAAGTGLVADGGLGAPRALLAAPTFDGPTTIERLPIQVSWQAVPGAASYRVRVLSPDGTNTLLAEQIVTTPTARWIDLADGSYVVRVRAIDDLGLEGLDADRPISVQARPEPPFAVAPVDGGRAYGARPSLQWTRAAGAASYDLEVATDAAFTTVVARATSQADPSATPELPPGQYFWRVASRLPSGHRGPFGDPLSFTLKTLPERGEATGTVDATLLTARWSAGQAGEQTQVQFAQDAQFTQVLMDQTVAGTEITMPRPAAGTYYLRVRGIDADGEAGPFGTTQQIDVPPLPKKRRWWPWLAVPAAVAGGLVIANQ